MVVIWGERDGTRDATLGDDYSNGGGGGAKRAKKKDEDNKTTQ